MLERTALSEVQGPDGDADSSEDTSGIGLNIQRHTGIDEPNSDWDGTQAAVCASVHHLQHPSTAEMVCGEHWRPAVLHAK